MKLGIIAVGLAFTFTAWATSAPPPVTAITAPPLLKQKVVPFAPHSATGWTVGCVLLGYGVSSTGLPENIRVLDSAPDHALDRLAVSTLTQWRYRPATRDGQPVAAQNLQQLLSFRAPGSSASPPYRLCGGEAANGTAIAATAAPPTSTARVNLDVTRPAVMQTFQQAMQSSASLPRQGRVTVRFCVNPQGHTENLRVAQSVPAGVFDQMALMLMRAAVFKPHVVHGYAVTACNISQPIVFKAAAP